VVNPVVFHGGIHDDSGFRGGRSSRDCRGRLQAGHQPRRHHEGCIRHLRQRWPQDHKELFRLGSPGDSKTRVLFTDPAEIRGVELLSYNHKGDTDRQWLYIPATRRTRSVTPRERSDKFAGTDFTYEDVEERVLDDFNYRLLSDTETIDGHKTYKVEARPVDATRSQYSYIYYWVAQDVPVILHAEMYDQNGKLVRELHASGLKKASGISGARHVEMKSVQEKTRTVLTIDQVDFNRNLDEKLFTPEGLDSAPAVKP
jgi:hypothetical protein